MKFTKQQLKDINAKIGDRVTFGRSPNQPGFPALNLLIVDKGIGMHPALYALFLGGDFDGDTCSIHRSNKGDFFETLPLSDEEIKDIIFYENINLEAKISSAFKEAEEMDEDLQTILSGNWEDGEEIHPLVLSLWSQRRADDATGAYDSLASHVSLSGGPLRTFWQCVSQKCISAKKGGALPEPSYLRKALQNSKFFFRPKSAIEDVLKGKVIPEYSHEEKGLHKGDFPYVDLFIESCNLFKGLADNPEEREYSLAFRASAKQILIEKAEEADSRIGGIVGFLFHGKLERGLSFTNGGELLISGNDNPLRRVFYPLYKEPKLRFSEKVAILKNFLELIKNMMGDEAAMLCYQLIFLAVFCEPEETKFSRRWLLTNSFDDAVNEMTRGIVAEIRDNIYLL
jgi:hypothetical protein